MTASGCQNYSNNSIWPVQGWVCPPPGWESNDILKEPAFVWEHRGTFSVSLPPHTSNGVFSVAEAGCRDGGREGWMDPPSTITFISHLLRCEEDASQLRQINWGLFSYEMQTEGKVITMTFLTSLKPFLHLLLGPSGLFSSLSVTNKYLIAARCCHTTLTRLQPTWRVTVTAVKVLLRSFHKRTFRTFFRGFLSAVHKHCLVSYSCCFFRIFSCQQSPLLHFKYDPETFHNLD